VLLERERLRQLRLHALEALAEKLPAVGRFGEAVQVAQAAVQAEPLRETARRALVRIHLAQGNVAEALRTYESFREQLFDELGVAPSSQMERLVAGIRGPRRVPALASVPNGSSSARTPDRLAHRVPGRVGRPR